MTIFNIKKPALIILTIHNLSLPEDIQDSSFQIKWKRGDNKGFTEKMFPQENSVHFEKRIRFNSTFLFSKDNKCRQKLLTIKVLRFKEKSLLKKPKIYGKVIIDLSMYTKIEAPLTSTYTLESQHKKKAIIMITTQVKFIQKDSNILNSLDIDANQEASSLNTANLLSSDHVSSWDVSTMITPDDSNYINSQSKKIESSRSAILGQSNKSHQALQSCIIDHQQRNENMKKRKRDSILQKTSSLPKPALISPSQIEEAQAKLNNFFAPSNPKQVDQNTVLKSKKMSEMYLSYQVSLGLMKGALNYPWCNSPVPIRVRESEPELNSKLNDSNNNKQIVDETKDINEKPEDENTQNTVKNDDSKNIIKDETPQNTVKNDNIKQIPKEDDEQYDEDSSSSSSSSSAVIPIAQSKELVSYPKPSSAIFAAILHTQILQKNVFGGVYFDSLIENFFKNIDNHKFVRNCTPVDTFSVYVHLLALLEKETIRTISTPDNKKIINYNQGKKNNNYAGHLESTIPHYTWYQIDKDRYFMFYNHLAEITIDSFSRLCENLVDDFNPYVHQVFLKTFDPNFVIEGFAKCFQNISDKKSVEKEILSIAEDYISLIIDSKLVEHLIKNPKCCTLTNSIQWNYLVTSLEAEVPQSKLTLFKEASSVIMMAKNICTNPVECDEIAPHLPKLIVYTVLRNLTTCEYMPALPNPEMFFKYYRNDIASKAFDYMYGSSDSVLTTSSDKANTENITEKNIILPSEFNPPKFEKFEDIIASINTSNWKDVKFTEKEQMDFSFIDTIFNGKSEN